MLGMYVHQHWPYRYPYAARTWTLQDWRGYASGLQRLGYNAILLWPVLETIPDPPTASDRLALEKHGHVIDLLHRELGMRVYVVLCPNVGVNSAEAAKASFEERHYFYCDTRVNPADPVAMAELMQRREWLLRPLATADGVAIIDSDPGGYPGSTNAEFVHLLTEHRKLLDRLREGIELIYWMHAGWEAYGEFYTTGQLRMGTPEEHTDCLKQLARLNPEPWCLANGLTFAQDLGFASRVMGFNYGLIEPEPSFPMTRFGGQSTYEGARSPAPRGVMGNAQTHCVQLPNTFAFARGAQGLPLTDDDYREFAEELIPTLGACVLEGWQSLAGANPSRMQDAARALETAADWKPAPGPLGGLLFGSPVRFLEDLALQLRMRAALHRLAEALERGQGAREALADFADAAELWQGRHGYQNLWWDPEMIGVLRQLDSENVNRELDVRYEVENSATEGETAFLKLQRNFRSIETHTTRLLHAVRVALDE